MGSPGGVIELTKTMALELTGFSITINTATSDEFKK
jgi:hypothetical protein